MIVCFVFNRFAKYDNIVSSKLLSISNPNPKHQYYQFSAYSGGNYSPKNYSYSVPNYGSNRIAIRMNQNNNIIKVDKEDLNADYFASLLNRLIDNPSHINEMKKGAEKTAKEYLDYRIIAEQTLKN